LVDPYCQFAQGERTHLLPGTAKGITLQAPPKNRRRNIRAGVALPVAWQDQSRGVTQVTTTIDLSASGVAVRSPERLARWTPVYLVVGHESLGLAFEASAHIVRSASFGTEYVLGLEFNELTTGAAADIGRFVLRQLAEPQRAA
jgi:c-di-GMP-binding flagellar brake protein YcgR